MKVKTSAHYQREFRQRMRQQGLVKKEVWIRPEHAARLSAFEKKLRTPDGAHITIGANAMNKNSTTWTTVSLYSALKNADMFVSGQASVELIEGIEASLHITMHDYGDLPLFMSVSGDQIVVESLLWPVSDVDDKDGLNLAILKTHKLIPLSTIGIDRASDGEEYYQMFGALNSASNANDILFQIEVLAANVIQAVEAYAEFLSISNN